MQIISYFLLLAWREGQTDNKQGLGEKGNLREKKMKKNNPILLTWDMMSCLAACCRCLSRMSPANTSPDLSIVKIKACDWSIIILTRHHVQVPEELGQQPRNLSEGAL